jgi:alpha-mannosidase
LATTVTIVPHTHWDREWHQPFQVFRARLVHLLDELLPLLEADARYAHFLLDGQTAVIDDYLEMRPEHAARLEALAAQGRVAIGPWAIQMDEYMVSGETIVRDLQAGLRRAEAFGGVMEVGYLPDMFGHIAQMPQLFSLFDFEHAVVWRGVPSQVQHTAFWWEAPDGSRVRAEYLCGSYSNGRDLANDAAQLVARASGYEAELGAAMLAGAGLLLMNGTDHQMPQPWLGELVEAANAKQSDYEFVVASLRSYLDAQPSQGLDSVRGELRSGARSNVLMGVASNRVDIHQLCAQAERSIERLAEPMSALFAPKARYPHAFLDTAWDLLITNSAHDSSCACSNDEVVDAVQVRYQEARALGRVCTEDALGELRTTIDTTPGAVIVANPTAHARDAVITFDVPGAGPVHLRDHTGTPRPTQVVARHEGEAYRAEASGDDVLWLLDMIRGPEFAGVSIARYTVTDAPDGALEVTFESIQPGDAPTDLQELRDQLAEHAHGTRAVRLRRLHAPSHTVAVDAGTVPGLGWTSLTLADGPGPEGRVHATDFTLDNGQLHVAVNPHDGTLTLTTPDGVVVAGADRLVDGGDGGDTYNYSPPARDAVIDTPIRVHVARSEAGPVRGRLIVSRTYAWPVAAIGNERSCSERDARTVEIEVRSTVELRAHERFVRIRTEFTNPCRDHRLRMHVPLPAPVTHSNAECAFTVVERGLTTEGGPNEVGLPTWVSRRFVDASNGDIGIAVLHDGLLEYELVNDGSELALTLMRAVGYLSRSEMVLRPNPAGPLMPLVGAQMQRPMVCEYALYPHAGTWVDADCYAAADAFTVPLPHTTAEPMAAPARAAHGHALAVTGAEVSSLRRTEGGAIEVRVYNPRPTDTTLTMQRAGNPARGEIVNLRGRVLGSFDGTVALRGGEIMTIRLAD